MAYRLRQMVRVHDDRAKPALPEMPGPAVAGVDMAGVAAMNLGKGPAQSVLVRGSDRDVNRIGHEAIGQDLRSRLFVRLVEQVAIESIVVVVKEGLRLVVSALGKVVGNSLDNEPGAEP
jgi:hypothetical protein